MPRRLGAQDITIHVSFAISSLGWRAKFNRFKSDRYNNLVVPVSGSAMLEGAHRSLGARAQAVRQATFRGPRSAQAGRQASSQNKC